MRKAIVAAGVFALLMVMASPAMAGGECGPPQKEGGEEGPRDAGCWVVDSEGKAQGSYVEVLFVNDGGATAQIAVLYQRNGFGHPTDSFDIGAVEIPRYSEMTVTVRVPDPPRGNSPYRITGKIEFCSGDTNVYVL